MATISENLQIIADSTAAIKQAIIDKGGDVSGDITTLADAISGISGGGSAEEEITFTGTVSPNAMKILITGVIFPTFSEDKRIWIFSYSDSGTYRQDVLYANNSNVSLSLSINSPVPPDPSCVTMFLTDLDGGNAKMIKTNF